MHNFCYIVSKVHSILPVTIRKCFSYLQNIEGINFGCVSMLLVCDALSFLLIIFSSDLVIRYTDKLLIFRWVQIVLLL